MNIVLAGKFYEVDFPFNKQMVTAIKNITGRRWHPVRKLWLIPRKEKAALELWADKFKVQSAALAPPFVGEIPDMPELTVQIPLTREMYPYQAQGVAYNLRAKRTIIGDKPGLGKTIQAIATIVAANAFPCFIICPNTLKLNWQQEWQLCAGRTSLILDDSNRGKWARYIHSGKCDVFIVNYESVKSHLVAHVNKDEEGRFMTRDIFYTDDWALIRSLIVDESHRIKDPTTQTAKFVVGASLGKEFRLSLTGTPIVNKTDDLITQLYLIGRMDEFGGHVVFKERYCKTRSFAAELNYMLRSRCFYQRRKEDVLKQLPAKIRRRMLCDITTRSEYQAAIKDLGNYLRQYREYTDKAVRKSLRGEVMVQIGVCKDISARGKMAETEECINVAIENGEKVIVFYYQKNIRDMLARTYPHSLHINGDVSLEQRDINVKRFQNEEECNVFLINYKSGGVGLNLTAADHVLFPELPWHAADCEQCEDRAHRIGREDTVYATYLIGKNTIDEFIYELIEEKRDLAGEVTGNEDTTQEEILDRLYSSLFNDRSNLI